jgi:hypothetical protein
MLCQAADFADDKLSLAPVDILAGVPLAVGQAGAKALKV